MDIDNEEVLLDDGSTRLSLPVDDGLVENDDICMMDVTDNALDIPVREDAPSGGCDTHLYVLETANNAEEKSDVQTADVATDSQSGDGDAAKSDGTNSEGGAVYMSLCALAVAGACFFYQKLWKS